MALSSLTPEAPAPCGLAPAATCSSLCSSRSAVRDRPLLTCRATCVGPPTSCLAVLLISTRTHTVSQSLNKGRAWGLTNRPAGSGCQRTGGETTTRRQQLRPERLLGGSAGGG